MLLLSRFSHVRLCGTPEMTAHQAPPSLGFSRQEHWSGLPFPSPTHESESEVSQSCLTLSNPMDYSLPGPSIHDFQARVLEWGAIASSVSCFSRVQLCGTPETAAHQAPRPWDSPGKNTGVGCHFLLQRMKVKVKSLSCV